MKKFSLFTLTVFHFCVDLSCIYYLLAYASIMVPDHQTWLFYLILYNFAAFGLPVCIGVLADMKDRTLSYAAVGCLLVWCGFLFRYYLTVSILLLGTGNGLFHIGGGRKVLINDKEHYAPGGIFISSGAMGVFFGRSLGGQHLVISSFFQILMSICVLLLICLCLYERKTASDPLSQENISGNNIIHNEFPSGYLKHTAALSLFLLFAVIFLRSLYGSLTVYTWNNGYITGLIFTICIAAGKFTGGIAADLIGLKRTVFCSLTVAALLAVFSFNYPVCGMISILCFNMTMPVSLSLLDRLLPNMPGSAFGILMMALFLGTLPGILGSVSALSSPAGLAMMCGISLLLLWRSASLIETRGEHL